MLQSEIWNSLSWGGAGDANTPKKCTFSLCNKAMRCFSQMHPQIRCFNRIQHFHLNQTFFFISAKRWEWSSNYSVSTLFGAFHKGQCWGTCPSCAGIFPNSPPGHVWSWGPDWHFSGWGCVRTQGRTSQNKDIHPPTYLSVKCKHTPCLVDTCISITDAVALHD